MTNIELYINEQLCDILSPENLGVRLNRVLINPAELNTKDAQYSYSITIPATPDNDHIFKYANVEEVRNKFNHLYMAQLYVDSIRIFDGRFKLSEIDEKGNYKGNLVLPAKKTIKEIFGDKKMNEAGEWKVNFKDMVESFNRFNTDKGTPECIFPMVLYGLLPKVVDEQGKYTSKTVWDQYVRLGVEDFPPSINCLEAVRQLFHNLGENVEIVGTAFDDPRLTELYMSYQNPVDYQQPWNWGHLGKFSIKGSWSNYRKGEDQKPHFESYFYKNDDQGRWNSFYTADLFKSSMLDITSIEDQGTNIISYSSKDEKKQEGEKEKPEYKRLHITIPQSGLYKIKLKADLTVRTDYEENYNINGSVFIGQENPFDNDSKIRLNNFQNCRYEVKLLRDFGEGSFDITDMGLDGSLYRDNLPQDNNVSNTRYFPIPDPVRGCVQMIDHLQNEKMLCGFRWGDSGKLHLTNELVDSEHNPLEEGIDSKYKYSRIMAIKYGWSWDKTFSQKNKVFSAIDSAGYKKILGTDADETELPSDNPSKFVVKLNNSVNSATNTDNLKGEGNLSQVVWLEKGEHLTLVSVSECGHWKKDEAWMIHDINFDLSVEPFRKSEDWITIDNNGTGTAEMDWNAPSDFLRDQIDLIKFLPSEQKIDEWLDNFCKAFNLDLIQPEEGKFELNVKQQQHIVSAGSAVNLEEKASVERRTNQPLGLPSAYKLGFKINKEEEGYVDSAKQNNGVYDDGGGSLETGSIDGKVLEQASSFSYSWFKPITQDGKELQLPMITHNEIWVDDINSLDYSEMMKKLYTNYAQRFWYRDADYPDKVYNAGLIWNNEKLIRSTNPMCLAMVSSKLRSDVGMELSYHNRPNTILTTYFNVLATDDSNYTLVECYLSPDEYEQLDGSKLIQLNSDLYYIASVEGYDPIGRNPTKLKLIRKV